MNQPYEISDYGPKTVAAARAGYEFTQLANPGTPIVTWDRLEESKKHEWCLIATAVISKYLEEARDEEYNSLRTEPCICRGIKPGQEMRIDFLPHDYIQINVTNGPMMVGKMGIFLIQEVLAYHLQGEEEEGEEEVD